MLRVFNTVWKYSVPTGDAAFALKMPIGAMPLSVHTQNDRISLWAEVDPGVPKKPRRFRVCGTGSHTLPKNERRRFIGTALLDGGEYVYHIFEVVG